MLAELSVLSGRAVRESRAELLVKLTDLFFISRENFDEHLIALFEDVVCRVLYDVDVMARAELAKRLASYPAAPAGVMRHLARDEIDVAEPVLRHSTQLSDEDLTNLANESGIEHLIALAKRIYLSEQVTDILIEKRDQGLQRTVVGNEGAQISYQGYRTLLDGARTDHVLQQLMALRPNMPDEIRTHLLPLLTEEVRRRLAARGHGEEGEHALRIARLKGPMDPQRLSYLELQSAFDECERTLDDVLAEALRLERHDWVVDLLAFAGPLDRARVMTAMLERDPRPICIVCKALDVSADNFMRIINLRARRLGVGSNAPELRDDFEQLDIELALQVIRHLRFRMGSLAV